MIAIEVTGGLGNQLQQYALYKKLEIMGADVRLDFIWFSESVQEKTAYKRKCELDRLGGISYKVLTDEERAFLLGKDSPVRKIIKKLKHRIRGGADVLEGRVFTEKDIYHPELFNIISSGLSEGYDTNMYIRGFFACEYYYADILKKLKDEIKFPVQSDPLLSNEARGAIENTALEIKNSNAASVHIRRGDYLDENNKSLFGGICTNAYYEAAVKLVKEKKYDKGVIFYVFSDDTEFACDYADKLFKESGVKWKTVNINHGDSSLYDIYLMSLCRYNICANSTFSFWGARFNSNKGKIMIRPTKHKNSQRFDKDIMTRLWKDWIFISPSGDKFGSNP